VLLHTSHYTEDADTQGYQILLKDGRLCWEIVHHWPGSAAAVRTAKELPLQQWVDVVVTYDGSSEALGLAVFVDGVSWPTETVRDHLQGPATVRTLELAGRDRDQGFTGGRLAEFAVFDHTLSHGEVAALAGRHPDARSVERCRPWNDPEVLAAAATLRAARQALHAHQETIPELMVMARHPHPPERFVLAAAPTTSRPQPAGATRRAESAVAARPQRRSRPPAARRLAARQKEPVDGARRRRPAVGEVLRRRPRANARELRQEWPPARTASAARPCSRRTSSSSAA
jgi:hypothetical protein